MKVPCALNARSLAFQASVLALVAGTPALAQDESGSEDTGGIPVIIVTAQKVKENVQDVPIAITAVSGEALNAAGVTNLENINRLVPSVTFRKGTTSANSAIFLRGVGTITFSIAAEPSVSTVVDGVVLSRSGQAFADVIDVERIEVLRGPQGTLFGKNASAGLINIVSKGGSDDFEAEANLSGYEGGEYRGKLSVAGPLAEGLTARLTGSYADYDGNIKNVFNDTKINGYEHYGLRGIVDYEPSDTARFRLIADYFRATDDCCAEVTGVSRGAVLDGELGPQASGVDPVSGVARGDKQRFVNQNLTTQTRDRQWSVTAQGDFDVLENHTLTLIGGYRNWDNTELREGDFLPRPIVGTAQLHDEGFVDTEQYSAEIRLASDQSQTITYQVGGFYWHSDNSQRFTRRDITCASSTLPVDPVTGGQPCNLTDTVNTLFPTASSISNVNVDNYAVFGQVSVRLAERLKLTGGLRWTRDELDFIHFRAPGVNATDGTPLSGPGISGNPAGGTIANGGNGTNISAGGSNNNNVSGKAVLQFDATDDIMTYASYTRGYKGPAFNVFFNHTAPNNAVPIDAETSDAYEIGLKSQMFDRRLQVNISAYLADYSGFQANNFILLNGTVITNLTNAGDVRTKGVEVETLLHPMDGLNLSANVAYNSAKVRQFNPNPITNAPSAQNGTHLPLAPEWTIGLGANYESSLESLGLPGRAYFDTTFNWTDNQYSDLGEAGPIGSYGIWSANLGFSDEDDKYRLTFHIRNITDESYATLNTSAGQRLQIPRDADRYVGVSLRVRT